MTQRAIFTLTLTSSQPHAYHLEYQRQSGVDLAACKRAIQELLALREQLSRLVLAFGHGLWSELAPQGVPAGFHDFEALESTQGFSAPSTQGDLFVWLHADEFDELFDASRTVHNLLREHFELIDETHGFVRKESRDLTGFIDGSANPTGDEIEPVAIIPAGQVGAGGSHVITMKWIHDLDKFAGLSVAEQEQVFGRTKRDSIEFEEDKKPENSHVGRSEAEVDGVEQALFRQSTPYGTVAEHGLYFLAFSSDASRFDIILQRMFGLSVDGIHDRLIEFSQAIAGAYWLAPSEAQLAQVFG